jgi:ribosomal-protein-alanine N-acetyltransferase
MIRPTRPADESALAALQSHLEAPSPALLTAVVADGASGEGALVGTASTEAASGSVEVGGCLVSADSDDRPVGYALWVGTGDHGDAHLAELVVHPDHRRAGRARALLRRLLSEQSPGTQVTLLVAADSEPARALYESVGFRAVWRRPDFYETAGSAATDAIVYAREV